MTFNGHVSSADAPGSHNGRVRLDSWKSIAGYLNRDVRTVERWAKGRGLPVHRTPGEKGHCVFAYCDELDTWLVGSGAQASEEPRSVPRSRRTAAIVAGLILTALVLIAIGVAIGAAGRIHEPVFDVRVTGNSLSAIDRRGQVLWSRPFPRVLDRAAMWGPVARTDSGVGILVGMDLIKEGQYQGQLEGLSGDGSTQWIYSPNDRLQFVGGSFQSPWGSTALLAYSVAGRRRVAWAAHHHTWWPSILFIFDEHGTVIDRFIHAGWITEVAVTADGRYLLASGVSQEHDAAMLAVLDVEHVGGSTPTDPKSTFASLDGPPGKPVKYFVLPYPELRRFGDRDVIRPEIHAFPSGAFELRIPPGRGILPSAEIIYEFSSDLSPVQASASEPYWEWHRHFEVPGGIDHSADQCPERSGFDVREWSPQLGWTTLRVKARPSGGVHVR